MSHCVIREVSALNKKKTESLAKPQSNTMKKDHLFEKSHIKGNSWVRDILQSIEANQYAIDSLKLELEHIDRLQLVSYQAKSVDGVRIDYQKDIILPSHNYTQSCQYSEIIPRKNTLLLEEHGRAVLCDEEYRGLNDRINSFCENLPAELRHKVQEEQGIECKFQCLCDEFSRLLKAYNSIVSTEPNIVRKELEESEKMIMDSNRMLNEIKERSKDISRLLKDDQ